MLTFDQLVEDCKRYFHEDSTIPAFSTLGTPEARTLHACQDIVDLKVQSVEDTMRLLGEIATKRIPMTTDAAQQALAVQGDDWLLLYRQLIFFAVFSVLERDKQLVSTSEARAKEFNI